MLAGFALAGFLFAAALPVTTFGQFDRRSEPWSQVGANRLLQLGPPSQDVKRPELFGPSKTIDILPAARPEGTTPDAPVDFNGDGRTDFVVVRNTGGGPSGQLTWYYAQNGGSATAVVNWGLNSDWIVTEDFDGDLKDDVTIWRPGPAGQAAFYILLSASNTVRIEQFGQTGDIPTIVGDYDGDGIADPSVFRNGAPAVWYYRGSFNNPGGNVSAVAWGVTGDILAPGDFDGDGRNDFGIARNSGTGQLEFWRMLSTGAVMPVTPFGTSADFFVPGDYDGDGRTDLASLRSISGQYHWQFLSSANGTTTSVQWGGGNDYPTQGDYDGDGKTDIAIWRRGVNPGDGTFWALLSSNGSFLVAQWGSSGDFPVAANNVF